MPFRVIDTSSVILLKEIPRVVRPRIVAQLDGLVDSEILIYPAEVLGELERFAGKPDEPLDWARRNEAKACRFGPLYEGAKRVLGRVPNLIDPEKVAVGGLDVADPYVVALGVLLKEAREEVVIVTDDTRQKPRKTSLSDAAGLFGIPSITFRTFLIYEQNIWDGVEGT